MTTKKVTTKEQPKGKTFWIGFYEDDYDGKTEWFPEHCSSLKSAQGYDYFMEVKVPNGKTTVGKNLGSVTLS